MNEKPIYFTRHSQEQMLSRNTDEAEVSATIRQSKWYPAEKGRLTASKVFDFNKQHYGRYYSSKEVIPIFVEEKTRIVVITIYTFFFSEGGKKQI